MNAKVTLALLTTVTSLALTSGLHADTVPQNFHGAWCYDSDNGGKGTLPNGYNNLTTRYYRTTGHNRTDIQCSSDDHEFLSINRKGWIGVESGCDIATSSVVGTEDFRPVYEIIFKNCSGEAYTWNEAWRAYIDRDGFLHVRQRVTNQREQG